MSPAVPSIVRIKRKRTQDPLQALVFETSSKRTKTDTHRFYRLARTDALALEGQLLEGGSNGNVYLLPRQSAAEPMVPNVFAEMVDSYLAETAAEPATKQKRPRRRSSTRRPLTVLPESDGYVYDVYHQAPAPSGAPQTGVGVIRLHADDMELVEEESDHSMVYSDDEDLNAEDFYRNDYPEDGQLEVGELRRNSSGAMMSDDEDDGYEIQHNRRRFSHADYLESEGIPEQGGYDSVYQQVYGDGGEVQLLDDHGLEEYQRHVFHPSDRDLPLAQYRDRIFGALQQEIERRG